MKNSKYKLIKELRSERKLRESLFVGKKKFFFHFV